MGINLRQRHWLPGIHFEQRQIGPYPSLVVLGSGYSKRSVLKVDFQEKIHQVDSLDFNLMNILWRTISKVNIFWR